MNTPEITAVAESPKPGINPRIASQPNRMSVPGTRKARSSQYYSRAKCSSRTTAVATKPLFYSKGLNGPGNTPRGLIKS
jgi:hypothetical protein